MSLAPVLLSSHCYQASSRRIERLPWERERPRYLPLCVAWSAIVLLQQLLGLFEHQVLSRSEGDPLNAVSSQPAAEVENQRVTGNSGRERRGSGR